MRSERLFVRLTRTDSYNATDIRNENLAITHFAGARSGHNGLNHLVKEFVFYGNLYTGLRNKVDNVLSSPI